MRKSSHLTSGPDHDDTHVVVLSARDEAHLLDLEQRLLAVGYAHAAVREPDAPFFGAITAIGLPPAPKRSAPRFLSKLSTIKEKNHG